jgi:PAS domain S-box-containing protein
MILIFSRELTLQFISGADATASFCPLPGQIGQPIEAARSLITADPTLPLACRAALKGEQPAPCTIGEDQDQGFLRHIELRPGTDTQPEEVIVSYLPGPSAPAAELAGLRRRLSSAIEAVTDPIGYFDAQDRLILCNQAYAQLHATEDERVTPGMHFEEILRQDLRNSATRLSPQEQEAWLAERLEKRKQPVFETEMRLRDGRWFRVMDRATDEGGRVHALINITSLKNAEKRLREMETGAQVGIWTLDLQGQESQVNHEWAAMLGYDAQDFTDFGYEEWRRMVHPDDLSAAESGFLDCIAGQAERFDSEYRMRHRAGHWVWILGRGGVFDRCPDGNVRQMAGITLDISRRKSLEGDLGLRAAAVMVAEDAIMITDAVGRILDVNPALCTMAGASKEARTIVGQSWDIFYDRQEAAELAAKAFPELRKTGFWQGTAIGSRLNGDMFDQELSLTEMPDGKIVWVSRDVSARNALAQSQQRLKEDVERAQRQEMINLLTAGLTHDFSNLLSVISNITDPDAAAALDPAAMLPKIHMITRQMIDLLEPLRDFKRSTEYAAQADLRDILSNAINLLRVGSPRQHDVYMHLPAEAIMAALEPLRLTQVLLNLGLNARDALGEDEGAITFVLSAATRLPEDVQLMAGTLPDERFALFTISDTGPGIPSSAHDQIWKPYFTTKGAKGTGLGLPLVATIMRDIGGAIGIKSAKGLGTVFYVAWPIVMSAPPTSDDDQPDVTSNAPDDNAPDLRRVG